MTIPAIKSSLTIKEVLAQYGLESDKNGMLKCPFHEDKTPSMQIYQETDTAYCFSSNCKLHGKSIDQIDFVMYKEGISKHEAIEKAKTMAGILDIKESKPDYNTIFPELRKNLLRSKKAEEYLKTRHLSDLNEIGYNYKTLKELRDCLIFPLKNKEGEIVSLYGRSINNKANGKHYYSSNRSGLYPNYPSSGIKTLILTESIIDTLSVKQNTEYEVLSLYGANGLTEEHKLSIKSIKSLEELIFFLDGDGAGEKAIEKYSKHLHEILPEITISKVLTPKREDPNSLLESHEKEILAHLIENRITIYNNEAISDRHEDKNKLKTSILDTKDSNYLYYKDKNVTITILGGINLYPVDRLKVTLKLEKVRSHNPLHKLRHSLDLYNDDQLEKLINKTSEKLEISTKELQITITTLIEELENYREEEIEKQKPKPKEKRIVTEHRRQKAIEFLTKPNLLQRTNELIGKSGVIGEEINRLLMYLVFTSRLREEPLHIISLGASGTGKTYLQEKISSLIPEEHKLEITTLSENALYYFEKQELKNKLVLIEDLDGAQEDKILYALRELMSKKQITKTIPIKDSKGNLKTITLQVEGPITLSGTTTREKLYEDNANRSILIYLDNSKDQKEKIMEYQRSLSAGKIDKNKEQQIKEYFKDMQSVLRPIKIINPYATKLKIPQTDFKPLRTNSHYLNFIEIITFYKQYQREQKTNEEGERYVETTLEDIKEANVLLKEVLLSKSDELTKACRNFLEMIKRYLTNEKKETFYSRELRQYYRIAPSTLKRYLLQLRKYGYLNIVGGIKNKGFEYEIDNSDAYKDLKNNIDTSLERAYNSISIQRLSGSLVAHL